MPALQPHGPAPYTTAVSVTTVLDAYRDRGLGSPITPAVLIRAGVGETIANRTLNSMKLLGLITDDGLPTQQFEDFRRTRGDEEYRARVQEWLRGLYADILQYTDPSVDSAQKVAEAFRTYEPSGQRAGMAGLLIGLWRYAGLPVAEAARAPRPEYRPPRPRAQSLKPTQRRPERNLAEGTDVATSTEGLPPGLIGLLHQIPRRGGWPKARRDDFLAAFAAVLDFSVPVREFEPDDSTDEDGDDDS